MNNSSIGGMGRNKTQDFWTVLNCLNSYTAFSIGILSYHLMYLLYLCKQMSAGKTYPGDATQQEFAKSKYTLEMKT